MGSFAFNNNVRVTLNTGISDSAATVLLNEAVAPLRNPPTSASADKPARFTLMDDPFAPTKIEIIQATGVSAPAAGVVTLTGVTRGLEGTTAQSWAGGSLVMQSVTAGMLQAIEGYLYPVATAAGPFAHGGLAFNSQREVWVTDGTWIRPESGAFAMTLSSIEVEGLVVSAAFSCKASATFASNLSVVGTASAASLRVTGSAPANSSAAGAQGEIRYDSSYIYVCTAPNTWKRAALSSY